MSMHPLLALSTPPDAVAAGTVGLAGGDVVMAVVGFAVLFVVFGTRPFDRSTDRAADGRGGCGACDGGACGGGGCATPPSGAAAEEAP